jgi:CxxC motif-containing protein
MDDNKIIGVEGQKCERGKEYALQEIEDPQRILTSTVKIANSASNISLLPVRSDKSISKKLLFTAMHEINNVRVTLPVKCGEIIIKNILDTNVNIIAEKTII